MALWLVPRPRRNRPGCRASSSATAGPITSGVSAQMLTMPLATVAVRVASRSWAKRGESPGSKPPEDHSVA